MSCIVEELRAALAVLEWLPEDEGDWAECPCCGAPRMNGHIPDGCQLSVALERAKEHDCIDDAREAAAER